MSWQELHKFNLMIHVILHYLKGACDVAKKNVILCIWCNAMCLRGPWFKNTLFSTYCTLLLLFYAPPFWNAYIFTKLIILRSKACSDWPAIWCVVIGRIPQVWRKCYAPSQYCDGLFRRDKIKTIKPIINEAFVASSGDIITDYNDLYCLFTCCIALRQVNIIMFAFMIRETTNNKQCCRYNLTTDF